LVHSKALNKTNDRLVWTGEIDGDRKEMEEFVEKNPQKHGISSKEKQNKQHSQNSTKQ